MGKTHARNAMFASSKALLARSAQLITESAEIISRGRTAPRPLVGASTANHSCASLSLTNPADFAGRPVRQESNQRHPEVLNSWKEIAAYLDRGVRTVQRWECELGLPVRRPRQARRSAVIAFKSELDQWLSAIGTAALACETADPIAQLAALEQRLKQLQAETLIVEIKIKQINNGLSSVPENRSSDAGREAVA